MTGRIEGRLRELGVVLPVPATAVANYVPWVISGSLLYISGQLPLEQGKLAAAGHLGEAVSIEDGYRAARLCALNLLAQASAALEGDFDRIVRLVRLSGFVACVPSFGDHPKVVNGASDLMVEVLGDAGRHTRVAVGVAALPLGAAVEVDAVFEIAGA
jgi:enamine deaminase RidA (YjgF/YER057c/UK114 family)